MPVLCEDNNVPYIFVSSKEKLGEASSTKRPTSVTMIVYGGKNKDTKAAADYKELYDECYAEAKDLVRITYICYVNMETNLMFFIGRKTRLLNQTQYNFFFSQPATTITYKHFIQDFVDFFIILIKLKTHLIDLPFLTREKKVPNKQLHALKGKLAALLLQPKTSFLDYNRLIRNDELLMERWRYCAHA
jgi:large-conductance mechanosensitive channel